MNKAELLRKEIIRKTKEYYKEKFENRIFEAGISKVNYAGRVFDSKELTNLVDCSLDFWLTESRYSKDFALKVSNFLGVDNVLLVNSGSSANLIAISTLTSKKLGDRQLLPGDEVITVAACFPTTVAPIIQNNLIPVFVDVDLETYNIYTERIYEAISEKTKAIFIAHTMGNPFNLKSIREICNKKNLWLIEDNCDSFGSKYNGAYTGIQGDIGTLSFYPAHHITTGEGGAVITSNDQLAKIAESYINWGRDCYCKGGKNNTCGLRFNQKFGELPFGYDHKYVYSHLGYNFKMTEMQAAIGAAQMEKLNDFVVARKENFNCIYSGLKKFEKFLILPKATEKSEPAWFGFLITVRENAPFSRNELTEFLENRKIETRNLFAGNLTKHPAFLDVKYRIVGDLRNTDYIMNNTFFIGTYPGLSFDKVKYVLDSFNSFFKPFI